MGTPDFAVPTLDVLCENGYKPVAVVTGRDKRRGRGKKLVPTPVKHAAERHGISTIFQPRSVKSKEFADEIRRLQADLAIIVAFRILPERVFSAPRFGSINLHGSLLPRYRGAAPIHHAVLSGDTLTGVTTFFLKPAVDTGNMILQKTIPIEENATTGDVHDVMMHVGAEAVLETVRLIEAGDVKEIPQDDSLATPAPKVFKHQAGIPWDLPSERVHNHIRGYSPTPGAWTYHGDTFLKILRSKLYHEQVYRTGDPGRITISDGRFVVQCGSGCIEVIELQQSGRRKMSASEFLRGYQMFDADVLASNSPTVSDD